MAAPPTAWVLNLDADLELAAGPSYSPTRAVSELLRPRAEALSHTLLRPNDVWVDAEPPPLLHADMSGDAFCLSPRAVARLVKAGVRVPSHPSFDVLRRVNSRAFCASLGTTLPGACFATTLQEALDCLGAPPPVGQAWRIKRAFGMAGRGQRVVTPAAIDTGARATLNAWMRDGGVQIEPDVEITQEWSRHARIAQDGSFVMGALVMQQCDEHGQWLASIRARGAALDRAVERALADEVERVAHALHSAGYFGPFGIDAFEWRAPDGSRQLQPRSEINARYSMGFPVGFA